MKTITMREAIAETRGLFDGPASPEVWARVVELLDACEPAALHELVDYIEGYVSRWPHYGSSPDAPHLVVTTRHGSFSPSAEFDERAAPTHWLSAITAGEASAKFELVRRLELHVMLPTLDACASFLANPSLVRVRELDVGESNPLPETFYADLKTSALARGLDTITLRRMTNGHAEALLGEHAFENLRTVRLGFPETRAQGVLLNDAYTTLFEADWWSQVVNLELQLCTSAWSRAWGTLNAHRALAGASETLTSLRHLVLGDDGELDVLCDSALWSRVERLSLRVPPESGRLLLYHLDSLDTHSVRTLDLSRTRYANGARWSFERFLSRYIAILLEVRRIGRYERIVLPYGSLSRDDGKELFARCASQGVELLESPY